jgi:sterol desaturase/sphingolipid hydroxylase (fatty acid hydroxylase superfamily)
MWDQLLEYFATLEKRPIDRMAILVGGLLFFWILEGAIPLLPMRYKKNKIRHAAVNFAFTVMHLIIHTALAVLIVLLADWCAAQNFGLVYWFHSGIIMTIVIGVLALDFSSWLVHWVMHKNKWLWRFHLIHHSDNNVDVTTGLRHHPGDSILRGIFFLLLIFVSGAPMYAVMIYQTLVVVATAFTHANINLPKGLISSSAMFLFRPICTKYTIIGSSHILIVTMAQHFQFGTECLAPLKNWILKKFDTGSIVIIPLKKTKTLSGF